MRTSSMSPRPSTRIADSGDDVSVATVKVSNKAKEKGEEGSLSPRFDRKTEPKKTPTAAGQNISAEDVISLLFKRPIHVEDSVPNAGAADRYPLERSRSHHHPVDGAAADDDDMSASDVFDGISDVASSVFSRVIEPEQLYVPKRQLQPEIINYSRTEHLETSLRRKARLSRFLGSDTSLDAFVEPSSDSIQPRTKRIQEDAPFDESLSSDDFKTIHSEPLHSKHGSLLNASPQSIDPTTATKTTFSSPPCRIDTTQNISAQKETSHDNHFEKMDTDDTFKRTKLSLHINSSSQSGPKRESSSTETLNIHLQPKDTHEYTPLPTAKNIHTQTTAGNNTTLPRKQQKHQLVSNDNISSSDIQSIKQSPPANKPNPSSACSNVSSTKIEYVPLTVPGLVKAAKLKFENQAFKNRETTNSPVTVSFKKENKLPNTPYLIKGQSDHPIATKILILSQPHKEATSERGLSTPTNTNTTDKYSNSNSPSLRNYIHNRKQEQESTSPPDSKSSNPSKLDACHRHPLHEVIQRNDDKNLNPQIPSHSLTTADKNKSSHPQSIPIHRSLSPPHIRSSPIEESNIHSIQTPNQIVSSPVEPKRQNSNTTMEPSIRPATPSDLQQSLCRLWPSIPADLDTNATIPSKLRHSSIDYYHNKCGRVDLDLSESFQKVSHGQILAGGSDPITSHSTVTPGKMGRKSFLPTPEYPMNHQSLRSTSPQIHSLRFNNKSESPLVGASSNHRAESPSIVRKINFSPQNQNGRSSHISSVSPRLRISDYLSTGHNKPERHDQKLSSSTFSPASLADDITVSTLDTVGASSRVVVYGDQSPFQSPRLVTSSLSPSFFEHLKKKVGYDTSVQWPTMDTPNIVTSTSNVSDEPTLIKDLSSFEWIKDAVNLYRKTRTPPAVAKSDFFSFSSHLYSSSSPKTPQDFPSQSDSTSKLVFNDSTLLLLHALDPTSNPDDIYTIVRRIWKRFLINSHYSDEITRSYEDIVAKKDYPHRISVTERVITVTFNILGLLSSNNLQGAIDFLHRFLKELGHYGIKPQDQITAYSYHNLGILYLLARRADLAQQYFFDSLNIQMRFIKGPSKEKLALLNEIGVTFFMMEQHAKALEIFSEALLLAGTTQLVPKYKIIITTLWSNKAAAYYYMGDKTQCIDAYNKVLDLYRESFSDAKAMESVSSLEMEICMKGVDDALRNMAHVYNFFNMFGAELDQMEQMILSLEETVI